MFSPFYYLYLLSPLNLILLDSDYPLKLEVLLIQYNTVSQIMRCTLLIN